MTCKIWPVLTFRVLKIAAELEKSLNFFAVIEASFLLYHAKFDGNSSKNNNVTTIHRGLFHDVTYSQGKANLECNDDFRTQTCMITGTKRVK